MSPSAKNPTVLLQLGGVKITPCHDYRQFCYAVLMTLCVAAIIGWCWVEGYLADAIAAIGPAFGIGFTYLLIIGLYRGLRKSWELAVDINTIKHGGGVDELKSFFGLDPNARVSGDLLIGVVEDYLAAKASSVEYFKKLAAQLGYFGTVLGIMYALYAMREIRSAEDALRAIPSITEGLMLAFATTLVGIVVNVALGQMVRYIDTTGVIFKTRVIRVLAQKKGASQ